MRKRRVTITGSNGQLGQALIALLRSHWQLDPLARAEVDLRDWRAVRDRITMFQPDLVIHAGAATDVDGCERDPEYAHAVNALGSRHVAQSAAAIGAQVVYISTNYVFDGTRSEPYHEFDQPNPVNVYGASKLAGEVETRHASQQHFILRTAWLYSASGRNFVRTMRRLMNERPRLTVVDDQYGNPTLADDLAAALVAIVDHAPFGTYHVVNSGIASWHEWASEIARVTGSTTPIDPIPAREYQRPAAPPANGALVSLELPALGITLRDWRDALRQCLSA